VTVTPLAVDGAFALAPDPVRDERGWFARIWDAEQLTPAGMPARFVQQSAAWNARAGTLRGLHVARPPAGEAKIVRCVRGAALDVIVDLRPASPTFRRVAALRLDDESRRAVYVPPGCAHGYQTLLDATELLYDIGEAYRPELASGVAFDDPQLAIAWPLPVSVISERDRALPSVDDYLATIAAEVSL
jgi:dTDP-4-dehydrorhamnose 3,5-epimerase